MPASGWEKPAVENSVYDLQRRWATPVPKVQDDDELNAYLRWCCEQELMRTSHGQTETIGARFEHERAATDALPERPFDPCIYVSAKVDKYQTARFDQNRYSVPRSAAFKPVTIKGYIDRVQVVQDDRVIAEHARCYTGSELVLDPLHYLVTLGRRPATLDHAPVYRDWRLPAVFGDLREHFEAKFGPTAGARQFVRVLQLLAEHPMQRVQQAIEQSQPVLDAEQIVRRTQRAARRESAETDESCPQASTYSTYDQVQVPLPELDQFNQLLTSGATHE
jgi:hypothetical protein